VRKSGWLNSEHHELPHPTAVEGRSANSKPRIRTRLALYGQTHTRLRCEYLALRHQLAIQNAFRGRRRVQPLDTTAPSLTCVLQATGAFERGCVTRTSSLTMLHRRRAESLFHHVGTDGGHGCQKMADRCWLSEYPESLFTETQHPCHVFSGFDFGSRCRHSSWFYKRSHQGPSGHEANKLVIEDTET
jgi:hypothetical protein